MVMVYPLLSTSMVVSHPTGGKMRAEGVNWPDDSDTGRLIAHGEITTDEALAYKGEPAEAEKPIPGPIVATGGGAGAGVPGTITPHPGVAVGQPGSTGQGGATLRPGGGVQTR